MAESSLPTRIDLTKRASADESELVKRLEALEEEGTRVRDKWAPAADLDRDLQLFRTGGGPDRKFFNANFIEAFVDRMVAQLTDNRPIIRVESMKQGLRGVARALDRGVRILWEEADLQRQTFKMAHLAATMRSAGLYTGYDPFEDDIVLEPLRVDQVILDPKVTEAARVSKNSDYLSITRVVTLDELRTRFPGRGASVAADSKLSNLTPREAGGSKTVLSPVLDAFRKAPEAALGRAEVIETWVRDWRRTASGDPMFPGGRLIIRAKDLVLWDGPNPYWDGRWPVDWFDWGVDPQHVWGRSAIELLRHIQLPFNQLMDGLVRNQLLSNVMAIVADYDAVPPEMWKKLQKIDDTLIIRKQNRNATFTIEAPPAFGADKLNIARQMFTMAQLLTGVTDVTLGETPGSLQSGVAIEGLQEGANLMNRARASRLEDFYERVGQKLIARIFQFYDTDRVAGMLGPLPDAEEYGKKRQELFFEPSEDGELTPTSPETRRRALRDFRFAVSPGSSAPGTRTNRAKMMVQLHAAGLAAGEDVLAAADFPEPQEMLQRAQAELAKRVAAGIPPPVPPKS